jgi:hypothetical protein
MSGIKDPEIGACFFNQLQTAMHAHHGAIIRKEPRLMIGRLEAECDRLRDQLKAQWGEREGLVEAGGSRDWRRLFGQPPDDACFCPGLPADDHVSMWRKKDGNPSEIAVWVSQPYPLNGSRLREIYSVSQRRPWASLRAAGEPSHVPACVREEEESAWGALPQVTLATRRAVAQVEGSLSWKI